MKNSTPSGPPLLISFSGIDGAGKSTQINLLRQALQSAGLRVKLVTFWDDVATLKSFREEVGHKVFHGDKGVGSPEAPIRRRDKDVQSPMVTLIRMAIYLLDALSLRRTVKHLCAARLRADADVIIFDRFLYDELANLNLGNALSRNYVRAMLRIAPRPDVALVLDADPDAAFRRKPEYPLEFLHANRRAYLNLAAVAQMTVIQHASVEEAHAEVLHHVEQKQALRTGVPAAGLGIEQNKLAS